MTNKFSIVTVNYNDKKGLEKTVQSVINQSFGDYEFLIIDGGSNDGSQEVLIKYADRIKYISEADNGIYHAMNKGIKMATGAYILFLNSGDTLNDNNVLQQVNYEIDGSKDLYFGDILFQERTKTRKITSPDVLTFNFFFTENLPHQASFIKKELFTSIFYYNEEFKIVSDWEFLIYSVCKANITYKHLPIIVSLYDGTGLSSDPNNYVMMYAERDVVLQKHFPAFLSDYAKISLFKQRRVKQFLRIKERPLGWEILKVFMKILLLFIPKKNRNDETTY
ncbi:MAG: glycosyltransferase family 2 protein [Pedobacter sp.]